jgi:hypothetical protein
LTRTVVAAASAAATLTLALSAVPAAADTTTTTAATTAAADTTHALQAASVGAGVVGTTLPAAGDRVSVGGLTIRYPAPAHRSAALNGSTRVFDGQGYDQIVQSTGPQGVRLVTVLPDRDAPRRYAYTFEGHQLRLGRDGSVTVFDGAEPVATIEPAWALDAAGRSVGTRYEVDGDRLVQVVDVTSSTQFPVVADPSVKYHWWGFDVRFSKGETRSIATSTSGCTIVAGTIPDPTASKVVAAVCGALTLWADAAQDRGKCIAIKKPWVGGVVPWYWSC